MKNLNPKWDASFIYPNIHREEVKNKSLELTIWDWDRFKSNDFLGMVVIDLNGKILYQKANL
jgi:Ca2+-dependent lipid-binding protein